MKIFENKGIIIGFIIIAILMFFLFSGTKDLSDQRADFINNESTNQSKAYEEMANQQLNKIKANEKKTKEILDQ